MLVEVATGLAAVASAVTNLQTISGLLEDLDDHLDALSPEVRADLEGLLIELRKNALATASATSIVTNFRFTRTGEVESLERFNDRFQQAKTEALEADQLINTLRGSCTKIREHADHLEAEATRAGFSSWLRFFGRDGPEQEQQLAQALHEVYEEEIAFHNQIYELQGALRLALDDVDGVLAPGGINDPENIPAAAELLQEYRRAFQPIEDESFDAIRRLQEHIGTIGRADG